MRRVLPLLLLFCLPLAVLAYNLDGNRWPNGQTTFFVDIPGSAPSGISWNQGFEEAMAQWTDATPFTFFLDPGYVDPCAGFSASSSGEGFPDGNGDSRNATDFADDVCGNAFGNGVLAITLSVAFPGSLGFALISQTDILFNNAFDWDIYTGPRRPEIDFRRVALHELGHAVGLGHESGTTAMMAPSIGNIDTLQADDIAGAQALYGGPGDCEIIDLAINSVVEEALGDGDCAVLELYGGGDDTSFVDAYRLTLDEDTDLSIMMESAALDSVLIVTDDKLNGLDFDDDSAGRCDALITGNFPAGDYLILANTFVEPFKCPGNTGNYKISISDNTKPILTKASAASGASSRSIFHGGATSDGFTYKSSFLATESIAVEASIQPDPQHIGEPATFYVVAVLNSGQVLAKVASGGFREVTSLASIPAFGQTPSLGLLEELSVLNNLRGDAFGVSNYTVRVFVGYSLDSDPAEIYFNGNAIRFTID